MGTGDTADQPSAVSSDGAAGSVVALKLKAAWSAAAGSRVAPTATRPATTTEIRLKRNKKAGTGDLPSRTAGEPWRSITRRAYHRVQAPVNYFHRSLVWWARGRVAACS